MGGLLAYFIDSLCLQLQYYLESLGWFEFLWKLEVFGVI